jgi:uncharacterized protein DUF6496
MPEQETIERARKDKRAGKAASTQAGEFVREEIHHIREGKHGARSTKQAIAIGLSKARRAGVELKPPQSGPANTQEMAERDYAKGQSGSAKRVSAKRSRSTSRALRREGREAVSHQALSRQAHTSSRRRTAAARSASARKASRTRNR